MKRYWLIEDTGFGSDVALRDNILATITDVFKYEQAFLALPVDIGHEWLCL
jgi:hypothetical protein